MESDEENASVKPPNNEDNRRDITPKSHIKVKKEKRTEATTTDSGDETYTPKKRPTKKKKTVKKRQSVTPKQVKKEVIKENVDESESESVSSGHRTPKCQPLKRKALNENRETTIKQRKISKIVEVVDDDPFNFDLRENDIPEFFPSLNKSKTFGDLKFLINTPVP